MDDDGNKQRNPWLYIGGIWVCVALVQSTQTVFGMRAAGMHHAWTKPFVFEFISWLPWMLATRAVVKLGRFFPLTRLSSWSLHFAAIALIGTLCAGWGTSLEMMLAPWAPDELPGPFFATWPGDVARSVARRTLGGAVHIAVNRDLDVLNLSVYNDGPPLSESWQTEGGVGLANLKTRLHLMFGEAACLDVASRGISAA